MFGRLKLHSTAAQDTVVHSMNNVAAVRYMTTYALNTFMNLLAANLLVESFENTSLKKTALSAQENDGNGSKIMTYWQNHDKAITCTVHIPTG